MATSFYQVKNNAKSTITNNPLSAGGLSITLASSTGSRFPTTGNTWLATIWDAVTYSDPSDDPNMEVVLIDSRSTDTLTVNASGRGYAGTTGVEHATGSAIRLLIMKEHVDQITTAITTLEGASVGTYTAWANHTAVLESGATDWNFASKEFRYCQIGKMVFIQAYFYGAVTVGSATTAKISLPVPASTNMSIYNLDYQFFDSSGSVTYKLIGNIPSTDPGNIVATFGDGTTALLGNTVAANDKIYISGFYEAA